jgi:ABC-type antimicrobial peptide transport system permease subunit
MSMDIAVVVAAAAEAAVEVAIEAISIVLVPIFILTRYSISNNRLQRHSHLKSKQITEVWLRQP